MVSKRNIGCRLLPYCFKGMVSQIPLCSFALQYISDTLNSLEGPQRDLVGSPSQFLNKTLHSFTKIMTGFDGRTRPCLAAFPFAYFVTKKC